MVGTRCFRVGMLVALGSLCALGQGCKYLKELSKGKYKQENDHFACKLEVERGALGSKRNASFEISCDAKKQELELDNITLSYTFEEPEPGRSNSYKKVLAAEHKPLGDEKVRVTPEKPFRHKGTIRAAVRASKDARSRVIHLTARVSYPKGRVPGLEGFDKTMKDMDKNPSYYKVDLSANL